MQINIATDNAIINVTQNSDSDNVTISSREETLKRRIKLLQKRLVDDNLDEVTRQELEEHISELEAELKASSGNEHTDPVFAEHLIKQDYVLLNLSSDDNIDTYKSSIERALNASFLDTYRIVPATEDYLNDSAMCNLIDYTTPICFFVDSVKDIDYTRNAKWFEQRNNHKDFFADKSGLFLTLKDMKRQQTDNATTEQKVNSILDELGRPDLTCTDIQGYLPTTELDDSALRRAVETAARVL